jgi:hypothetical protein
MNMKYRTLTLGCVLLGLFFADLGPAQQAPARRDSSRPDYRDRYGVLSERNIFLRDRGRRRRFDQPTSRPAFRPAPLEDSFVLRGVVYEDEQYHAYVESLNSSTVLKLALGDAVASGKVSTIEIDAIQYEQAGRQPVRIEIGQTLTGGEYIVPVSTVDSTGTTTQPASAPAIDPNSPNLTLEQKMKLRRQQQLGQ